MDDCRGLYRKPFMQWKRSFHLKAARAFAVRPSSNKAEKHDLNKSDSDSFNPYSFLAYISLQNNTVNAIIRTPNSRTCVNFTTNPFLWSQQTTLKKTSMDPFH